MRIIHNNAEIDSTKEHEIISSDDVFGFDVQITFSKSFCEKAKLEGKDRVRTYHNFTEVHNLFESLVKDSQKRIAFESDIHGTGFWKYLDDIDEVVISDAKKLFSSFN